MINAFIIIFITLLGLVAGSYWLGRSHGADERTQLRQRGNEYRRKFNKAITRLEREQYNNGILSSRVAELERQNNKTESLENSVRKVTL